MPLDLEPGIIYVDDRRGSGELRQPLAQLFGIKAVKKRLPYGDFAFIGNGPEEEPVKIGVERKRLRDLSNSLLGGRLKDHQIPGLAKTYYLCWLLIEGIWRAGHDGSIEVINGSGWGPSPIPLTYREINAWAVSFDVAGGGKFKRWRTSTPFETCAWIAALYHWWQKPWKKHRAAQEINKWQPLEMAKPEHAFISKPSDLVKNIRTLPGIGSAKARRAATFFGSIHAMANASEDQWKKMGLTPLGAARVWTHIRRVFR